LRQLATIFETVTEEDAAEPRVESQKADAPATRVPEPSTSHDATAPRVLKKTRPVHQRKNRNNTPVGLQDDDKVEEMEIIEQAIRETKEIPSPPPLPTTRPRRTVAQYRAKKKSTEIFEQAKPVPITQDDEAHANTIIGIMPKLRTTATPCGISQHAIYHLMGTLLEQSHAASFIPNRFAMKQAYNVPLEHVANAVVHPVTKETITKYDKLANDPVTRGVWTKAFCKELGRLAQGWDGTKGTETIFFMTHEEIKAIPKDHTVTYARIVVDYRPQKEDPNRVRITVGGNLIKYPGELTTRTADLTTAKVLWNSTISTDGARYACADVGNFYLATPMERYEYMRIKADLIPDEFKDFYKLWDKIYNGYVYCEIRRGMYGLPQAGIIANQLLKKRLAKFGYFELPHTPGLWKHTTKPVWFTLVVDDFGVKYIGRENLDHLMNALKEFYDVTIDYTGGLYCGVTLEWNYDKRYVDISMPGYVKKQLLKYKHPEPKKPVHTPWEPHTSGHQCSSRQRRNKIFTTSHR
jgi:hypothetical protein